MDAPLITIGLIVRNGEKQLAGAIESLLKQSMNAFHLIIYDNASTDRTHEIAHQYSQRDRRVRVVRHEQNIGVLRNLIVAAECIKTPYFCWAAHDDLREPGFLKTLIDLLETSPLAGLACCAVRNIDPDGTPREVRPETCSLRNTDGMAAVQRLIMYLCEAPGTPFYGVFRTHALRDSIDVLREAADMSGNGPPLLGVDMVFLAAVIRSHGLAIADQPLLLFRRGGHSHKVDAFDSLRTYLSQIWAFHRMLQRATSSFNQSTFDYLRLTWARWRYLARYLLSAPMRRMTWHYLSQQLPQLRSIHSQCSMRTNPAFKALRRRARALPKGSRVVIFGAGKHTRRCMDVIRSSLAPQAVVVAVCDNAAQTCQPIGTIRLIQPDDLAGSAPDVILISSDAYEAALHQRALEKASPKVEVWCIYNRSLETPATDCSCTSTDARNSSMASSASLSGDSTRDNAAALLTR